MVINEDTEDDSPRGKEVKSSSKKKIDNDSDDDAFDTKPGNNNCGNRNHKDIAIECLMLLDTLYLY
jgi:hypothetical protein